MKKTILKLWKDEDGPTAVEYALMLGLIAVVILLAVQLLGQNASSRFSQIASAVGP
jgi:pilus assembly protein Flp/PilA